MPHLSFFKCHHSKPILSQWHPVRSPHTIVRKYFVTSQNCQKMFLWISSIDIALIFIDEIKFMLHMNLSNADI